MDLIKRIKGILAEPSKFFDYLVKNKKKEKLGNAFVYYAVMSLFAAILGALVGYMFQPLQVSIISGIMGVNIPFNPLSIAAMTGFAFLGYILGLGISFVSAALLHVWILIFGGKGNYSDSYKLFAYSRTPGYVLGWIPIVNFFVWIWSLVLLIKGTQKLHKISKLTSILMYIIPLAIIWILAIIALIFAFGVLLSGISSGAFAI